MHLYWLNRLYDGYGFKKDGSFIQKMNSDLQLEFMKLTGKRFDGKGFYLAFFNLSGLDDGDSCLQFHRDGKIPYAELHARLLFYKKQMNVSIVWFDKVTGNLYNPGDNIENTAVEFHWRTFDVNHPALLELGNKKRDVRKKFGWDVSYKIFSKYDSFEDLDLRVIIPIKSKDKIEQVNLTMRTAQESWNTGNVDKEKYPIKQTGLVHNLGFEEAEDAGKVVYSIDMGSADFTFLKYLFTLLDEANLGIKQIEIAE